MIQQLSKNVEGVIAVPFLGVNAYETEIWQPRQFSSLKFLFQQPEPEYPANLIPNFSS